MAFKTPIKPGHLIWSLVGGTERFAGMVGLHLCQSPAGPSLVPEAFWLSWGCTASFVVNQNQRLWEVASDLARNQRAGVG